MSDCFFPDETDHDHELCERALVALPRVEAATEDLRKALRRTKERA